MVGERVASDDELEREVRELAEALAELWSIDVSGVEIPAPVPPREA